MQFDGRNAANLSLLLVNPSRASHDACRGFPTLLYQGVAVTIPLSTWAADYWRNVRSC